MEKSGIAEGLAEVSLSEETQNWPTSYGTVSIL